MKYNKSKLFKNAWMIVRKWNKTLRTALRMAWAMARAEKRVREYYNIVECYNFVELVNI